MLSHFLFVTEMAYAHTKYYMIEFQDSKGRLIVVFRAGYSQYCVFVNGQCEAEFPSGKEAMEHARTLAERPAHDPTL